MSTLARLRSTFCNCCLSAWSMRSRKARRLASCAGLVAAIWLLA